MYVFSAIFCRKKASCKKIKHPCPKPQRLRYKHTKGISLYHGKLAHAKTDAHENKAGSPMQILFLKKHPMEYGKKQINNH